MSTPPFESNQQQIFNFISSVIGQKNIIPIPVEFIRFTGDANTAMLLNQIIYWTDRTQDLDKWFYKSYDQWQEELALNKYFVSKSVTILKSMGLIETKVKRIFNGDSVLHYKLNQTIFIEKLGKHLEKRKPDKPENKNNPQLQSFGNTNFAFPEVQTLHFPNPKVCTSTPLYTESIPEIKIQKATTTEPPTNVTPSIKNEKQEKEQKLLLLHHQDDVQKLINLIPNHNLTEELTPQFNSIISKGLLTHSVESVALAITYTKDKSKGSPFEFKSYLGKVLLNNFHAGYVSKKDERKINQEKQRQLEHDRRERERLKALKERQEIEEIKAQNDSRKRALESLKADFPDKYKETQDKAFEIYKKKYPNMKADRAALSIKIEMCKILGI